MKKLISGHYQKIKDFYAKYERPLMTASLVGGFLLDFITFANIDIFFQFAILIFYWFLAGLAIAFMQLYDAGKIPERFVSFRFFALLVVQFCFGGLLNISFIFYWASGAFSVSWPLMAITVLLLLFNDSFRHYFVHPLVQISVYYFVTFALFSLMLPFWFASLSPWLFVIAGISSLLIFIVYIYGIGFWVMRTRMQNRKLFAVVVIIFGAMNALYFTNIIPPIPLAMREAGLYHGLEVSGNKYVLKAEPEIFLQTLHNIIWGQTIHIAAGEKIYLFTAIFAPDNLTAKIVHHWQYYDATQKVWVDRGKLPFNINGGRQAGYKGYSWQSNLEAGSWRVYVENERGQVLAKVRFTVEKVDELVEFQEVIR